MALKCGFIGCGNMGGALAQAVHREHPDVAILLCDHNADKLDALRDLTGGKRSQAALLTEDCDYIFLGVKPQGMAAMLAEIAPALARRVNPPVLVSMAAGVTIQTVADLARFDGPIVRIMPNTPVRIGMGMVQAARGRKVTDTQMTVLLDLLRGAGRLDEISEDLIDAASALSGSGPAFAYLFAEELAKGAVACGLSQEQASVYAAQTLLGAAGMLLQTGETPAALRKAVCSPGGSTLAGLTALETESFSSAVQEAVKRAHKRSKELGQIS